MTTTTKNTLMRTWTAMPSGRARKAPGWGLTAARKLAKLGAAPLALLWLSGKPEHVCLGCMLGWHDTIRGASQEPSKGMPSF